MKYVKRLLFALLSVFLVFTIISSLISSLAFYQEVKNQKVQEKALDELKQQRESERQNREYPVLGVNDEGEGVILMLKLKMVSGEGRILLDMKKTYLDESAQISTCKAVKVAQNITQTNLSDKNIIISFEVNESEKTQIEGGSGGAAICLALVSLIQERALNKSVLITGCVKNDHSISKVLEVKEKARCARNNGCVLFLVPRGQKLNISDLNVKEVSRIEDAMKYILY